MKFNKWQVIFLVVFCAITYVSFLMLNENFTDWEIPAVVGAGLQLFGTAALSRLKRIKK